MNSYIKFIQNRFSIPYALALCIYIGLIALVCYILINAIPISLNRQTFFEKHVLSRKKIPTYDPNQDPIPVPLNMSNIERIKGTTLQNP